MEKRILLPLLLSLLLLMSVPKEDDTPFTPEVTKDSIFLDFFSILSMFLLFMCSFLHVFYVYQDYCFMRVLFYIVSWMFSRVWLRKIC